MTSAFLSQRLLDYWIYFNFEQISISRFQLNVETKNICTYFSSHKKSIYLNILAVFQEKLLKLIIEKQKHLITETSNLLSCCSEKKGVLFQSNISQHQKVDEKQVGIQSKLPSEIWDDPETWNTDQVQKSKKKEQIESEQCSSIIKSSHGVTAYSFQQNEFKLTAAQKIIKKERERKINTLRDIKLLNQKTALNKKTEILPYFNLCISKITDLLERDRNKNKLDERRNSFLHPTNFGESLISKLESQKFDIQLEEEKFPIYPNRLNTQKSNLFIKHTPVRFHEFLHKQYGRNPFFEFNLSPFIEQIKKSKNQSSILCLIDFFDGISKKWISVNQINPNGETHCFLLTDK